jgi:hypothetical protein
MHSAIFVILPILVGFLATGIYLRHFYQVWREIRLMLPMVGCSLEEAKRLLGSIEEQLIRHPALERKLREYLCV